MGLGFRSMVSVVIPSMLMQDPANDHQKNDDNDFHVSPGGILPDDIHLIARGVLLVFRGANAGSKL